MKTCIKCGEIKECSEFYFRLDVGKYRGACKKCEAIRIKQWNITNQERNIIQKKGYRVKNREIILEKKREYYHKNKKEISKRRKEAYNSNKERYRGIKREWWNKNKKEISKRRRKHYADNTERYAYLMLKYRSKNREVISKKQQKYAKTKQGKLKIDNRKDKTLEQERERYRMLTDSAVRGMLTSHNNLIASDVPQELIELKRIQMQIYRELKQHREIQQ